MSNLTMGIDNAGRDIFTIPFSDEKHIINMTEDSTAQLAVPTNATKVQFSMSPGAQVLISDTSIPDDPTGVFTRTSGELLPAARDIKNVETLYFRAINAAIINVLFYEG